MGFAKCVLYAALIGFLSFLLGRVLPPGLFREDRFPYRCFAWEQGGSIYSTRLHIKKWQNKVPDMSKLFPFLMQEKKMTSKFSEELPTMITETCIAEFIHGLLCILSLPCLLLWPGWGGVIFTLLYILGNIPFIFIQRYNRPRFLRLREKLQRADNRKDG